MAQLQSTSITGSLIVTQGITAQSLNVQYITSSIVYSSGSNTFGDATSDNQYFTGSILQSGSLAYFAGSVGIGTTNPSGRLTISTPNSYDGTILQLQSRDDPATYNLKIDEVVTSGVVRWSFGMTNSSAYSNVLVFDRGNVGIGVTTPGNLLTVGGSMRLVTGTLDGLFAYDAASGGAYIWSLTRYTDTSANDLNINTRSGFGIRTNVTSLTNSGHQFYITSGGNVGIGTTGPVAKLHVSGSSGSLAFNVEGSQGQLFSVTDSLSGSLMSVNDISGLPILEVFSDDKVVAGTFGSNALVVTGSSVGVGTPAPVRALDVYNSTAQIVAQFSSSNATSTRIKFSDANTGAENVNVGAIGTRLALWTNNTERLSILSGGNVGIGSTSPANRLDVLGTVSASAFLGSVTNATSASFAESASNARSAITASSADTFFVRGSIGVGTTTPGAKIQVDTGGSNSDGEGIRINRPVAGNTYHSLEFATNNTVDWSIGQNSNDSFEIYENGAAATTRLTVKEGGNVGIGTTSPAYKLHISGGSQYIEGGFGTNTAVAYTSANRLIFNNDYSDSARGPNKITLYDASWLGGFGIHSDTLGYYSGGTHKWYQATNATNAAHLMTLNSSGNLGLGTTNPGYKLEVQGTGYFTSTLITNDDFGVGRTPASNEQIAISVPLNQYAIAFYSGSSLNYGMHTNQGVFNFTGITGSAWNFQTGNVGIGTTSPSTSLGGALGLVVNGSSNNDVQIRLQNSTTGNTSSDGGLLSISGNLMYLWNYENNVLIFGTNNTERMRIAADGNVGIGSTAPKQKLDVAGAGGKIAITNTGTTDYSELMFYEGASVKADIWVNGSGQTNYAGANSMNIWQGSNAPMAFYTNGTNERMRIAADGNVGVGTSSPSATLQVLNTSTGNAFSMIGSNSKEFVSIAYLGYIRTRASDTNGANMHFVDNGNTKRMEMAVGSTAMTWYSDALADNFLTFQHTTGNIGIGVASPGHKLAVLGTVSASAFLGSVTSAISASFAPNFANTNLTLNGNRTHNLGGNTLTFTATSDEAVVFNHSSGGSFEINGSPTIQTTGTLQHRGAAYFSGSGTNVGIGTTSPGARLTTYVGSGGVAISGTNDGLRFQVLSYNDGARNTMAWHQDSSNLNLARFGLEWKSSTSQMNFVWRDVYNGATGSTELMRLQGNGNLGIGTAAPAAKLDIVGSNSTLALSYGNTVPNNPLHTNYYGGFTGIGMDSATAGVRIVGDTNTVVMDTGYYAGGTIQHAAWTSLLKVMTNGNVGIGTTNPGYKLDVRGTAYINNGTGSGLYIDTTVADTTTRDAIYLYEDDGQATGRQAISWYNGNGGGGSYYKARLWTQVGSSYAATVFGIDVANDAQTVATRLAIRNGNVGIGNITPSATLHVSGDVKASLASSVQPNFVAYNTSTGLLTYASTGSIVVGTATNADFAYVATISDNQEYSLVLSLPPHDEYERLYADSNNASYNPSTGTLTVQTLNAAEKSFVIPHQGLPGKKLVYGVLEGPEHSVYVRGRSKDRVIHLPEEWEWLVDSESITVSLTSVGKYCDLYVEQIESTSITVNSTVDSIEYFYHVYATRKDVEPLKTVQ